MFVHATVTARARPAVAENDACARGSDTSGRASRWPVRVRAQRKDRAGEAHEEKHDAPRRQKPPPPQPVLFSLYEEEPSGKRFASLAEPPGPQAQVQRHAVEQLADVAPLLQWLDAPMPQVVEQLIDAFRSLDSPMAEQVTAVPKISSPSRASRAVQSEQLTVEQLVEVPTIVSLIEVIGQPVEQTVDIPVGAGGAGVPSLAVPLLAGAARQDPLLPPRAVCFGEEDRGGGEGEGAAEGQVQGEEGGPVGVGDGESVGGEQCAVEGASAECGWARPRWQLLLVLHREEEEKEESGTGLGSWSAAPHNASSILSSAVCVSVSGCCPR